jgi:hypothetical protein
MRTARRLTTLSLISLLSACHKRPEPVTPPTSSATDVAAVIEASPDWMSLTAGDTLSQRRLFEGLLPVRRCDVTVIRQGIKLVLASTRQQENEVRPDYSRLYLVNRIVFDVPSNAPLSAPTFGSFIGVPADKSHIDLLWPLSYDTRKRLTLTGWFRGYAGPAYRWADEFDYFAIHYGKRVSDERIR